MTSVRAGRLRNCGSFPGIGEGFISTKLSGRLWEPRAVTLDVQRITYEADHSSPFSKGKGKVIPLQARCDPEGG